MKLQAIFVIPGTEKLNRSNIDSAETCQQSKNRIEGSCEPESLMSKNVISEP